MGKCVVLGCVVRCVVQGNIYDEDLYLTKIEKSKINITEKTQEVSKYRMTIYFKF